MAEVLPQVRVRADTQSRETTSRVETSTHLPLKDTTITSGNGRVIAPESVEGETPSQLPPFNNMEQPTPKVLAELLTPGLQLEIYRIPKATQASSCKLSQATRQVLRASLPQSRNGEIRKQLILYHTYVAESWDEAME